MALLVVGLGNPGERFAGTRHNIGFVTVDSLAKRTGVRLHRPLLRRYLIGSGTVDGAVVWLAKPLTFMNRSGEVLRELMQRCRVDLGSVVVVCDSLDLPAGKCRLKRGGGSGGHRGLQSVIDQLGTTEFVRLWIGIGRPPDGDVIAHVLGRFGADEETVYREAVSAATGALTSLATKAVDRVMNELNQRSANTHEEG